MKEPKLYLNNTQKGSSCLVYERKIYREGKNFTSGEIRWRCLYRSSEAAIKTNSEKTALTVTNRKHPVTMFTLSPVTPFKTTSGVSTNGNPVSHLPTTKLNSLSNKM
ncbi:hypothetical protein J6590_004866, partial [Homalodisca vitripennis]